MAVGRGEEEGFEGGSRHSLDGDGSARGGPSGEVKQHARRPCGVAAERRVGGRGVDDLAVSELDLGVQLAALRDALEGDPRQAVLPCGRS